MNQEATRGKRPSTAQALAQAVSKVLVVAAGRGRGAAPASSGEKASHAARPEPLARGAVAACDRSAAIDEAVSRLAEVNDDWTRERQMLEEGLNLPAGLVKWIQYGYLLRDVRLEERAGR